MHLFSLCHSDQLKLVMRFELQRISMHINSMVAVINHNVVKRDVGFAACVIEYNRTQNKLDKLSNDELMWKKCIF